MKPLRLLLLRLLAGWLCLGVHIAVATPVPALLTAAAAAIDGEHQVGMASGNGTTRVVLTHGARLPAVHHHCGFCRVLVSLSEDAGSEDHVLNFRSEPPTASGRSERVSSAFSAVPAPVFAVRILELPQVPSRVVRTCISPDAVPPQPAAMAAIAAALVL
jgi:hypothetical protein